MYKIFIMNKDFMDTQTGGEGETLQVQPIAQQTPEQFDVNITPPPTQEEPVSPAPVTPIPTESTVPTEAEANATFAGGPVAPIEPVINEPLPVETEKKETPSVVSEKEKTVDIPLLPSSMSMMVDKMEEDRKKIDVSSPYIQNANILANPTLDLINDSEPINQYYEADDNDPMFTDEVEMEEFEKQKELSSYDTNVQDYLNAVEQSEKANQQTQEIKQENTSSLGNQNTYESIINNIDRKVDLPNTYNLGNVEEVDLNKQWSSSNYNNWADIMGVDENTIDNMARQIVINQDFEDKSLEANQLMRDLDMANDNITSLKKDLRSGTVSDATRSLFQASGTSFSTTGKLSSTDKYLLNQKVKELNSTKENAKKSLEALNKQVKKKKLPPQPSTPQTMLDKFEERVNTDLKKIYSTTWKKAGKLGNEWTGQSNAYFSPVKIKGYDMQDGFVPQKDVYRIKTQAKWLDTEGRKLIEQSVTKGNSDIFFNNPEAKNLDKNVLEYARDIFEVEYNKDFQKTGKLSGFTYTSFQKEAQEIAQENTKTLNAKIGVAANDVVEKVQTANDEWINSNKKILNQKIDQTKKSMDGVLNANIMSEIQSNPNAAAIKEKYLPLIVNAPSQEEANTLNSNMIAELKTIPNIAKSFEDYNASMERAVIKLQADYQSEYYGFRQSLYTNSINDLKNNIATATREVYKGGVNNDLNIYQGQTKVKSSDDIPLGADGVVKSKQFKEASYWSKRKMISDQWEIEKASILNYTEEYIKKGVKKYPANKEEAGKHWSEWTDSVKINEKEKNEWLASVPERTGADARNRYLFYAVDDLLSPPTKKPTVFGLKSYAREELNKIDYLEKKFGFQVGDNIGNQGRSQLPISEQEETQLMNTKKILVDIMNHPDTDQAWYNELFNGMYDGFDIPILGAFVGIQRNQNLQQAIEKYNNGTFDSFDISMSEAQAALNKINEIKPPSFSYKAGQALAFSGTFMLEMGLTGGFNTLGKGAFETVTKTIAAMAKSSADDVARIAATEATEQTVSRINKIGAFIAGGMTEGSLSPRPYEDYTKNMIQNITVQELGTYDGLIAQVDNSSKGEFSEFMKAYGNYMGMATIERLGAHMPKSNISKEVLEYMGSETFLKRTIIGAWARNAGFKSIDQASDFLATANIPWDGILPEFSEELLQGTWEALMYGETMFGPERQNDGSKQVKLFGMNSEELALTATTVAMFSSTTALIKGAKATINGDAVTIESQDINGTANIAQLDRGTWNKFNSIIADKNLSWTAVSKMLEQSGLDAEQKAAMSSVFIKTRGLEILADPAYQEWKEDNQEQVKINEENRNKIKQAIEENEKRSDLTEEQKAMLNYDFMTTGLKFDQNNNQMNYWESLTSGGFFNLLNQNEDTIANADMPIVENTEDGETIITNTRDTAEELAEKKRVSQETKGTTPSGKEKAKTRKTKKEKAAESAFTAPVEINLNENDQKNEEGLSGEVGEGQEPKQAEPVAETSQEEVSPSGVVQEEQAVEEAPVEEDNTFVYKMNTEVGPDGKGKWENDFEIIDNRDGSTYGKDAAKWIVYNNVSGTGVDASSKKDALNIIKNAPAYGGEMWGEGTTIDFTELGEKQQNNYKEEFNRQKGKSTAPEMGTTATESANPFTELESTKGLKGTAKTKAVKDLKEKYGADYNRISKIDTNFASIVRDLEKNNLIEKDCG